MMIRNERDVQTPPVNSWVTLPDGEGVLENALVAEIDGELAKCVTVPRVLGLFQVPHNSIQNIVTPGDGSRDLTYALVRFRLPKVFIESEPGVNPKDYHAGYVVSSQEDYVNILCILPPDIYEMPAGSINLNE